MDTKRCDAAHSGKRGQAAQAVERLKRTPHFARFRHLYESRDGGLCLFEDERGHVQAVDASRLA